MDPAQGGNYRYINLNKLQEVSVQRLITPYNGPLF
jgi:hypothetical protein